MGGIPGQTESHDSQMQNAAELRALFVPSSATSMAFQLQLADCTIEHDADVYSIAGSRRLLYREIIVGLNKSTLGLIAAALYWAASFKSQCPCTPYL